MEVNFFAHYYAHYCKGVSIIYFAFNADSVLSHGISKLAGAWINFIGNYRLEMISKIYKKFGVERIV